jgi:hypothetical protein
MKNYALLIVSLFIFYPLYPLMSRILTDRQKLKQQCIKEAQQHMPKELKQCESLENIEKLLRNKERELWEESLRHDGYFEEDIHEFIKHIYDARAYVKNVYAKTPRKNVDHSLQKHDRPLYEHICHIFEEMEINPKAVDMVIENRFEVSMNVEGPLLYKNEDNSFVIGKNATLFVTEGYRNKKHITSQIKKGELDYFVPYHEGTHIIEADEEIGDLFRGNVEIHIFQEQNAQLLPLLKTRDIDLVNTNINSALDKCLKHHQNGFRLRWNKHMDDYDARPDECTQMLPYYLKIRDIMSKNSASQNTKG